MNLTNEDVREILELLDATPYKELHLQTDRFKLTLSRSEDGTWTQASKVLSEANMLQPVTQDSDTAAFEEAVTEPVITDANKGGLLEVHTPLPGTFYRAPKPGAQPFVEIGSQVGKESVIGIIETMKLMNSIHAGVSGEIVEICLANAEFAEQGTVLMRIRPDQL